MRIEESTITETSDFRVIIYPASRQLSAREVMKITETLFDFLPTWAAHGKPLSSSFKIEHSQFIIITVDEEVEPASGCSMDALNAVMRQLDDDFQLGLFDRMKACYKVDGQIITEKLSDFRAKVKAGEIPPTAEVFDFSKNTYVSFLSDFCLPIGRSWAGAFLPATSVSQ